MSKGAVLVAALTLVLALAVAGCGSGDQTATIGTSEITISEDEDDSFREFLGALLDRTPYLPSFQQCLEGQIEKAIDEDTESELEDLPDDEAERRVNQLLLTASRPCEKSEQHYLDPDASSEEFDFLRSSQAAGIGSVLRLEDTPDDLVECLERAIEGLPTAKLIKLVEGPQRQREATLSTIGLDCERQS